MMTNNIFLTAFADRGIYTQEHFLRCRYPPSQSDEERASL